VDRPLARAYVRARARDQLTARLAAAQARAEEIAAAIIDAPLDDRDLGTVERQQALLRGLDATYPLQQATFEVELPADVDGVQGLGWEEMQQLAARVLEPVPSLYPAPKSGD
jgi:hypothetical protein